MAGPLDRLTQARTWYLGQIDALGQAGWTKPSLCAGWTATHVVAHVATGDQLVRGLVLDATGRDRAGLDLPVDAADRQRRLQAMAAWTPGQLAETARAASEQAVAALGEALDRPALTVKLPYGEVPAPVAAWIRMNEYVIHGHDLQPAIGRTIPIPDWFIAQALPDGPTMMARMHQRSPHKGKTASFHLHRTDGEGEWILRAEGGQARAEATHGKADVAFRGPAEGLYWVLFGRGGPEEHGVEVHGDPALAAAFKEFFPGP